MAKSGSNSTSDSLALALHKCTVLHLAFLERTGIWGHLFWICRVSLAASNRELSSPGINNGLYHLHEKNSRAISELRSVSSEYHQGCKFLPALILCWLHLKAVFPYDCKMAEGVTEAQQSTTSPCNRKRGISDFWNVSGRRTFGSLPVDIISHLTDSIPICELPTLVTIANGWDLSGPPDSWGRREDWKPEENQGLDVVKERKMTTM